MQGLAHGHILLVVKMRTDCDMLSMCMYIPLRVYVIYLCMDGQVDTALGLP